MSIKEALQRKPMERERRLLSWSQEQYGQDVVLEKGKAVLQKARVPALFEELAEIIRPNFSDVKIEEAKCYSDASVFMEIGWNFMPARYEGDPIDYEYDAVIIEAYPLTEELHICNSSEIEILEKLSWGSDSRVVEDAIVRAYQDPMRMSGPPVRL